MLLNGNHDRKQVLRCLKKERVISIMISDIAILIDWIFN